MDTASEYARSVGTSGRGARAYCNPAIPSRQHRHLADVRDLSRFVRAASVAAAAGAERDPWRLAVALCARVRVRLGYPGLAEPCLVLQSTGLATLNRVGRVVDHRGQETPTVGDLAYA